MEEQRSVKRHTQIVTLAIDVDLTKLPPPESWDWASIGDSKSSITLIAAGRITPSVQREQAEAQSLAEQFDTVLAAIPREGLTEEAAARLDYAAGKLREIAFAGAFDEAVRDIVELP